MPLFPNLKGVVPDQVRQVLEQFNLSIESLKLGLASTNGNVASVQANTQALASATEQAVATLPAAQLLAGGSSTGLKQQANAVPTVNGTIAYVSTASSITWYWDGTNGSSLLTIFWPDGSSTQVPPANLAITGLSASTTYTFYPYFSVDLNSILFAQVAGGLGTPPAAYSGSTMAAATVQSLDGNASILASPLTAATTSSGSGGGSGGGNGGSCVADFTLVQPLSLNSEGLICTFTDAQEWIDIRTAHRRLVAVPNHLIFTDTRKMMMKELAVGYDIVTKDGLEQVTRIDRILHPWRKKQVFCKVGHLYWANGALSHNRKPL